VSFESGRKGGSGLCLGERDFDLNVSTRTQWQQKEKIANSYDDCGLKNFEEKLISKTKKEKKE
jgi:hypothetical protein